MDKLKPSIRFAIMCSGTSMQKWQADTITTLLEHNQITCSLIIFHNKNQPKKKEPLKNILWTTYLSRIKTQSKALQIVDLSQILTDVPTLDCQTIRKGKFSEYFDKSDIAKIKEYDLTFILKLSRGIIKGDILQSSAYGVWSFHHDDEMKYRGRPSCFWEIYNEDPVTGAILQKLTDRLDGGVVLKKEFFKTYICYKDNIDQVYLNSSAWPSQVCIDILNGYTDYLQQEPSKTTAPLYYLPTNKEFVQFLLKTNLKRLQDKWNQFQSKFGLWTKRE
ncbi:MAG TPA: hypothetical protein DCY88_29320 [Cyanobacteria bacterium UBA11372]|nr:hypothetical protein [Cyanobacteria bacterium UBA11372]